MGEYFFGMHNGHLTAKANQIAKRHGAWHVNYTEPRGQRRGWFVCPNKGNPFDQRVADTVMADIEAIGGINALRYQRDKWSDDAAETWKRHKLASR